MKKVILTAVGTAGILSGTAMADTLYDNGGPNGVNGYSNGTAGVFSGSYRHLFDDFVLSEDSTLQDFHWSSVWGTPGIPLPAGSSMELSFRSDAGGMPGVPVASASITGYSEVGTGEIYFSRERADHWVTFEDIDLSAGTYWFEANVVGPENNFWLTADQQNSECWVDYQDLGGFQSGTQQFGAASDLTFYVTGVTATPAPGALALLGLAGIAGRRRRRA